MKKLLLVLLVVLVWALIAAPANLAQDGERLYPFTRPAGDLIYGQITELRFLGASDRLPGQYGWLSWAGAKSADALVASLTLPGNAQTYFNPGTPANGWTPDHTDTHISIGDWVQALPGNLNTEEVRQALNQHIARKSVLVIPLYDTVSGQGGHAYYRVHSFAAFELQSYDLTGKTPHITGKFLRWVTAGF